MQTLKENVIKELQALTKLGICSQKVVEEVKAGVFDADIEESVNQSVSDLSDMIINLHSAQNR